MNRGTKRIHRTLDIAFFGNYLPRRCGIATFTHDLAEAVANDTRRDQNVVVAAMNDRPQQYNYPNRVKFEPNQESLPDYHRVADFFNSRKTDVVSLQHEFGIFGGDSRKAFDIMDSASFLEPKISEMKAAHAKKGGL